jgi:methylated-DNA-protein-cysteine methyltransferase-like protein
VTDDDLPARIARHRADGTDPDLQRAIEEVLRSLRPGDVVTYGEVAEEAGWPGRSRAVGRVLATSGGSFPWWRVVNAAGRLVPGHEEEQARRLAEEGIAVDLERGRVRPADRAH